MNGADHVIDGVAIPVRRFRRWIQVILLLTVTVLLASFFHHPDFWRTRSASNGDLILEFIGGMNPTARIISCVALEIWVIYSLIFQIIRPYFGHDRLILIDGPRLRGFDVWGRLITAPIDSIEGFTRNKALIKVRTPAATLRIPIAGLNISDKQTEHVVEAIEAGSRSSRERSARSTPPTRPRGL